VKNGVYKPDGWGTLGGGGWVWRIEMGERSSPFSFGPTSHLHYSLYWPFFVWCPHDTVKKMAEAYERETVKQWLKDASRSRISEMKKKGILPKGKWAKNFKVRGEKVDGK
jgi:hypothetical protein